MIIGGVAIVLVADKLWNGEVENMTREELNAVRGYVSNIQAIKDAHNTEQLPINYGTICTITANGWKLIEELKALEQEPCEDVISRKDAIKAINEMDIPEDMCTFEIISHINLTISNLPPVHPKPKTGHWIPCSERLPKTAGVYRVTRYYQDKKNPHYLVDACYFDGSDTWHNDNRINHERVYVYNIVAWQENPEPYKPQKREGI